MTLDAARWSDAGPDAWLATDTGRVREHNEDAGVVVRLGGARLLLGVADGVGGAAAGEVASRLAVDIVSARARGLPSDATVDEAAGVLAIAVEAAHDAIRMESAADVAREGMSTTGTFALVHGGVLIVAHVGDSRCYLFRAGGLHQVTEDDTLQARLVEMGALEPEEVFKSNAIAQSLGGRTELQVSVRSVVLARGDRVLLSSDGLHDLVGEPSIRRVMRAHESARDAGQELVRVANEAGGPDNATALVANVGRDDLPAPSGRPPEFKHHDPEARRLAAARLRDRQEGEVVLPSNYTRRHVVGVGVVLVFLVVAGWLAWTPATGERSLGDEAASKRAPVALPHGEAKVAPTVRAQGTAAAADEPGSKATSEPERVRNEPLRGPSERRSSGTNPKRSKARPKRGQRILPVARQAPTEAPADSSGADPWDAPTGMATNPWTSEGRW